MYRSITRASIAALAACLQFAIIPQTLAEEDKTDSTVAGVAMLQGEMRTQRLKEGAARENELVLYSSMPMGDIKALTDVFTRATGVKVKVWRSGSEAVLIRTLAEARGGRYQADIVENSAPGMEALHREKLLQQVASPAQADLIPSGIPAHREWIGSTFDLFVVGYNTNLIKKGDLPRSYEDLLNPKWKGKLGIEAEDQHWFAQVVQALGPDKGTRLFRDIVDTNGISVRKGHTLLANLVASGEVPLALTLYNYAPAQLKQQGGPIDSFIIPPAIAQFRAVGLLRKAPHPHAALLWYDFMLGEEAQRILTKRFNLPTNKKIDVPERRQQIRFVDPGQFLDMNEQWTKAYEANVTMRAGR